MSQHDPQNPVDHTAADEPRMDEPRMDETRTDETTVSPTEEPRPTEPPAPMAQVPPVVEPPATAAPTYKSGPAPTTSVIGLLGLLTAIAVIVGQATDLDIRWDVVGPVAVVGAGVLLVVLGLAGLRGQQFRG